MFVLKNILSKKRKLNSHHQTILN